MFDFTHWCLWAETHCVQASFKDVAVEFRRGKTSPKRGAAVAFRSENKLMELAFWETGEADFYGVDRQTGVDLVGFTARVLDDNSFQETFLECLSKAV